MAESLIKQRARAQEFSVLLHKTTIFVFHVKTLEIKISKSPLTTIKMRLEHEQREDTVESLSLK